MPGRSFTSASYRYGYNGKETDPETNTQDYGMRIYNPALGKFLSVDPLSKKYPHYTPYQFAGNKPIVAIDLDGGEDLWIHYRENDDCSFTEVIRMFEIDGGQRDAISSSMGGANIPNTGIVYTVEHLDGSKQVKQVGETAVAEAYKDNFVVRGLKAADGVVSDLQGSISNYGEGERLVKAGKLGVKGKFTFNTHSIGFDLNAFSSGGEDYAGIDLELIYEESVSRKYGDKSSLLKTDFKWELEGYMSGSSAAVNDAVRDGGFSTENKTIATLKGVVSIGPANAYYEQEIDLISGKNKGTGTISFGKTSSPGVQGAVKNKTSFHISTGETKLSR